MKRALLKIIRFYQTAVSPLFPPRCRFIPTCSQYALEAVEKYGALKGGWLAGVPSVSQVPSVPQGRVVRPRAMKQDV